MSQSGHRVIGSSGHRSSQPEVRNPVLRLHSYSRLKQLPENVRANLRAVLLDLGDESKARADHCWKTNKAPMAAYWKTVSVYARHKRPRPHGTRNPYFVSFKNALKVIRLHERLTNPKPTITAVSAPQLVSSLSQIVKEASL